MNRELRSRVRMEGFQKPAPAPSEWREVGMAVVSYEGVDRVVCSCGWVFRTGRSKVREDAIDRHFHRRHQGKGIRL